MKSDCCGPLGLVSCSANLVFWFTRGAKASPILEGGEIFGGWRRVGTKNIAEHDSLLPSESSKPMYVVNNKQYYSDFQKPTKIGRRKVLEIVGLLL